MSLNINSPRQFKAAHGLTLISGHIQGLTLESIPLASEVSEVTSINRLWMNENGIRYSVDNGVGGVKFLELVTNEDFNAHVAKMASTEASKGAALVGFDGYSTTDVAVGAGNVRGAIRTVVDEIQASRDAITALEGKASDTYLDKEVTAPQTIKSSHLTVGGDVTITGDLRVQGDVTEIVSEQVNIADNIIQLNSNVTTGNATENAGLSVLRGDAGNLTFIQWNESSDKVEIAVGTDGTMGVVATEDHVTAEITASQSAQNAKFASTNVGEGAQAIGSAAHNSAYDYDLTVGTVDSAIQEVVGHLDTLHEKIVAAEAATAAVDGKVGVLTGLKTTVKTSIVASINEVHDDAVAAQSTADQNTSDIGALSGLTTTAKNNLVAAINEVKVAAGQANDVTGVLADLATDDKSTLVAAINEVDSHADQAQATASKGVADAAAAKVIADKGVADAAKAQQKADANEVKIGTLTGLATDAKDSLVDAVNELQGEVTAVEGRATTLEGKVAAAETAIGTVADLETSAGDLASAVNEVRGQAIAAQNTADQAQAKAEAAYKEGTNARTFRFESTTAEKAYVITHSLDSKHTVRTIEVFDPTVNQWFEDEVMVHDITANGFKIALPVAFKVRVTVIDAALIA